jgi:hypothetical protein
MTLGSGQQPRKIGRVLQLIEIFGNLTAFDKNLRAAINA